MTQWLGGAAMLVLSVIALPVMMKFFNWTVGAASSGGGGGLGLAAGAGAAGIHALASHTSSQGGARDYARYMDQRGGGDGPAGRGGIPPLPTPTPSPTSGGTGLPSFTGVGSGTAAAGSTAAGSTAAGASTATTAAAGAGATAATAGAAIPLVVGVQIAQAATNTLKKSAAESGAS
jgi:hypothetical protein